MLQAIIFGVLTGSILAVATVGFAMVRQTQGFLNIAHGQYLALGAYLGLLFADGLGMNIFLAALLAVLAVGAIGAALAWLVFIPVRRSGALVLFFSSIGLAYAIYGIMRIVFEPGVQTYPVDFGRRFEIGSASITAGELVVIGTAAVSVAGLHLFVTRTRFGHWIRAVASNPDLASVRGVPPALVSTLIWFIASGLGALAGILVGTVGSVHSEIGWAYILTVLAAAVVGGVGSVYGVIVAGVLLGVVMEMSTLVLPTQYRLSVAFVAIIVTLLLRPQGLFSVARRREEIA
ncbi:MAG: branched-chain amino acid transport system permease protein [Solirubrobacteraceae bacterium]|nr:branched-chain amino acid transport system permease protein [Solirubrobacteraceae bacterium]